MLPVLLVVLGLGVWALAAVGAQLRCTDAAALAARAAARGDAPAAVEAVARAAAPPGASVTVSRDGEHVTVRVAADVAALGGALRALPPVGVSGSATAAREDVLGTAPP